MDLVATSKLLTHVLRHEPERIGIQLDEAGWVSVPTLLEALRAHGQPLSRAELRRVVETSDKQRFGLDDDRDRIPANQGHTIPVDLGLPPAEPPKVLYHGTAKRNVASIMKAGLSRGDRHDVHLSPDQKTARQVGSRRGDCVVLRIDAARMAADGHCFRRSENGVWLTTYVPPAYIEAPALTATGSDRP